MPVLAWNIQGAEYPQLFIGKSRAEIRKLGIASHYVRRALPWQVRSAITVAKMPVHALYPSMRLAAWRIMFGYMSHELSKQFADMPGKLALKEAGKRLPAGVEVPKIAALIQVLVKSARSEIKADLDTIAPYKLVPHPLDPSKYVYPSKVYRTAHTVIDLKAMLKEKGEKAAEYAKSIVSKYTSTVREAFVKVA